MRTLQRLGALIVVAFTLSAIGAAAASAAHFTASATGELEGSALETQVWTINAGQIKCSTAKTTGKIVSTMSVEQEVETKYSGCTAFGFASVHISNERWLWTANGTAHLKNTVVIDLTMGGCQTSFGPQTVGTISFSNSGSNTIVTPHVTGMSYTTSPPHSLCGTAASNGTHTGAKLVKRVGGGWVSYTP